MAKQCNGLDQIAGQSPAVRGRQFLRFLVFLIVCAASLFSQAAMGYAASPGAKKSIVIAQSSCIRTCEKDCEPDEVCLNKCIRDNCRKSAPSKRKARKRKVSTPTAASANVTTPTVFDPPIIQRGDAVVAGFSGVAVVRPKPGRKIEDYVFIDHQAASLQVFDLSQMFGPDDARLVKAPRLHTVPAKLIGQVFGVALDDGTSAGDAAPVPNIYATATSAYGLQIVETEKVGSKLVSKRAKVGSARASWMKGLFGLGGGPGSVWKIDGRTGKVSLFANVKLNGADNSGPGLGDITFDSKTQQLFVSDLQTGMIHAFDLTGREVAVFDHGTNGRARQGLSSIAFNPASRSSIASPKFNTLDPATWGFDKRERRVWGLGVFGGRLYYSAVDGPDVWSVGITPNGGFADDGRVEIEVFSKSGDPITAISFDRDGAMYLSQRGHLISSYDYAIMARPGTAEVQRYLRRTLPNGKFAWEPAPHRYAIGLSGGHRSGNGGTALGYGYDENGFIQLDQCEGTLWSTGDILRQAVKPAPGQPIVRETIVHGLQGNAIDAVRPDNQPPRSSYYIDYDGQFSDPSYRGHMGQVAIWGCSGNGKATSKVSADSNPNRSPRQGSPSGPDVRISKQCSAAGLGDKLHCAVTVYNAGTAAPTGPVGFEDAAKILTGPSGVSAINVVSFTPDDISWDCSPVPASTLSCQIDGALLKPGNRYSVDVIIDLSPIAKTSRFQVLNCASLSDQSDTACASGGGTLIVRKKGPRSCEAGGLCTFSVSMTNAGQSTFDGDVFVGDNISIPGLQSVGVAWVAPQLPSCNLGSLPFQCITPLTLGPGSTKTFDMSVYIPASTVPPGAPPLDARNCFIATNPNLIPGGATNPAGFLNATSQMLSPTHPLAGPGFRCVNFQVTAPTIPTVTPSSGTPIVTVSVTPKPPSYSAAGVAIAYDYTVTNTGLVPISNISINDDTIAGITCASANTGPLASALAPGASIFCNGTLTTQRNDIPNNITNTVTVTGTAATGIMSAPQTASATVVYRQPTGPPPTAPRPPPTVQPPSTPQPPVLSVSVSPAPGSFSTSNQDITYTYTITNKGKIPTTRISLVDTKANSQGCTRSTPLAPGASMTCTGRYTTTGADVGRDLVNHATVYASTAQGRLPRVAGSATVKFVARPALELTLKQQYFSYSGANQRLGYNYIVTNTGSVPLTNVNIKDSRVPNINCGSYAGALNPGAQLICVGTYVTRAGDVGNDIQSIASARGTTASGTKTPADSDDAIVKYIAPPAPRLDLVNVTPEVKKFDFAGQIIPYSFTVQNVGNVPIGAFRLTLPPERGGNPSCSPVQNGTGPLAAGAKTVCQISYRTTAADVARGTSRWDIVLQGNAILPGNSVVQLNPVIKQTFLSSKPGANCLPGDVNCRRAAQQCGVMQPKAIIKIKGGGANGYVLSELFETTLNPNFKNYKPWFTGCRGNTAFARSFPPASTFRIPAYNITNNPKYAHRYMKAFRGRACDIFCSNNGGRKQCATTKPGMPITIVDEVPPPTSAYSKQKILLVCPWKIDDSFFGIPVVPVPVVPPVQASTFCWKDGGSGSCPAGFTDCGLGCQLGGTSDCAIKIVGQVFSALKAIPFFGDLLGGIYKGGKKVLEAAKKILGFGSKATSAVSQMSKVDKIKAVMAKYRAYNSAKAAWQKSKTARNLWNVNKAFDRGSSLTNTAAGTNIPRQTYKGFGRNATQEQMIHRTFHDVAGIVSIIPGPVGTVAGVLDAYGHPVCRK